MGRGGRHDVTPRLEENNRVLAAAYRALADDVHQGQPVEPAADWLLDNFHLLREQGRAVRRDLPFRYYRTLPKLAARELAGKARSTKWRSSWCNTATAGSTSSG